MTWGCVMICLDISESVDEDCLGFFQGELLVTSGMAEAEVWLTLVASPFTNISALLWGDTDIVTETF